MCGENNKVPQYLQFSGYFVFSDLIFIVSSYGISKDGTDINILIVSIKQLSLK